MVSLAGLSATYPGYLKADEQSTVTDINKMKLLDAQTQQAGQQAFGNTIKMFQSQVPGAQPMQPPMQQGPQAPMPGQASVPQQPPQAPPMGQQSAQGGMPLQQQAAQGSMGGGQGAMDWRQIATAVAKANPGAPPEVIAAAVTQFLPLMNAQAQMEWKQYALAIQQQRLGMQEKQGAERLGIQRGAEERRTEQGKQRLEQAGTRIDLAQEREKRLAASAAIRQDQQYQRLELAKQNLERQITQGGQRQNLAQWRATVDAQHKRALEIISSQAAMMPQDERKKLLAEQNENYKKQLDEMRDKIGSSTPTGGTTTTPSAPKIQDRVRKYNPETGMIE